MLDVDLLESQLRQRFLDLGPDRCRALVTGVEAELPDDIETTDQLVLYLGWLKMMEIMRDVARGK